MIGILLLFYGMSSTSAIKPGCNYPEIPDHGRLNGNVTEWHSGYPTGSVITYECETQFTLMGHPHRKCEATGHWSGSLPICESDEGFISDDASSVNIKQSPCGIPERAKNIEVNYMVNDKGVFFARYQCPQGYGLDGKSLRMCENNGRWSGIQPICKALKNSPLSSLNQIVEKSTSISVTSSSSIAISTTSTTTSISTTSSPISTTSTSSSITSMTFPILLSILTTSSVITSRSSRRSTSLNHSDVVDPSQYSEMTRSPYETTAEIYLKPLAESGDSQALTVTAIVLVTVGLLCTGGFIYFVARRKCRSRKSCHWNGAKQSTKSKRKPELNKSVDGDYEQPTPSTLLQNQETEPEQEQEAELEHIYESIDDLSFKYTRPTSMHPQRKGLKLQYGPH